MELTVLQHDGLKEIINIGFGKAAATLSVLTNKRVILKVPELSLVPFKSLDSSIEGLIKGEVTTIHQVFKGKASGNALLVLSQESASILVDLISHGEGKARRLLPSDREALIEIGNILLNSYVGAFGNILNVQIRFMVPGIQSESVLDFLDSMAIENVELSSVIIVKTEFVVGEGQVNGFVLIIMSLESIEALIAAIDSMAG